MFAVYITAKHQQILIGFTCGEDVHRRLANMFDQAREMVGGDWDVVR